MAYKLYNLISNYLRRFFYPTIGTTVSSQSAVYEKNQDRFCGPGQNLYFLKFKLHLASACSDSRKSTLLFLGKSTFCIGEAYCSLANRSLKY